MLATMIYPTNLPIAIAWAAFLLYWIISSPGNSFKIKFANLLLTIALALVVFGLFLFIAGGYFPENVNLSFWPSTLPVGLLADLVALVSLVILIWSRRTLGANWSANVRTKRIVELVQSGPYAYVRHPIYTGVIGLVFATAVAYGHLIGVLIWAVCTVGFYVKSLKEDLVLADKFKNEYLEYKAKTKALFPFIL
jgi:protein-S-isoprenylcysteine O-methyltransferase Ste14